MAEARKFLLLADQSEESHAAAYFAARRAHRTGAKVAILAVVEPDNFETWLGVGEAMRREALEAAEAELESLAEEVEAVTAVRPELILREGEARAALKALIDEDPAIAVLVLGARAQGEAPGPLVSALAKGRGFFGGRAIPITVVPGDLSIEAIHALT